MLIVIHHMYVYTRSVEARPRRRPLVPPRGGAAAPRLARRAYSVLLVVSFSRFIFFVVSVYCFLFLVFLVCLFIIS